MVAHLVYESGNDGSSCNMHVVWVKSMGKETVFFSVVKKSTQPVMLPSKTQCWNSQEKKEILFKGPSLRKQPTLDAITGFSVKWHLSTNAEIPYWWYVTTQIWVVLLIGPATRQICMEFLQSFLRRHFAGNHRNFGSFFRLLGTKPSSLKCHWFQHSSPVCKVLCSNISNG